MPTLFRAPRVRALYLAAALCVGLMATSACNVYEGRQFGVSLGRGYYVRVFQKASNQIEAVRDGIDHGDNLKFIRDVRAYLHFSFIEKVSMFTNFFKDDRAADFGGALDQVKGNHRCLMAHYNPTLVFGGAYNWTSSAPGGDCLVGYPIGR